MDRIVDARNLNKNHDKNPKLKILVKDLHGRILYFFPMIRALRVLRGYFFHNILMFYTEKCVPLYATREMMP